jgi:hypothetical protein
MFSDVTTIKARCGDWNLKIRNLADLEPCDYQERISSNILVHPSKPWLPLQIIFVNYATKRGEMRFSLAL